MNGPQTVIKVFLVNGESRSLRLDSRMDVTVGEARVGRPVCGVGEYPSGCRLHARPVCCPHVV